MIEAMERTEKYVESLPVEPQVVVLLAKREATGS